MDLMINSNFVKELRLEKAWTQEQLAIATGVSLRTIQRAEKDGSCSLETTQALAAVFGVEAAQLRPQPEENKHHHRGRTFGLMGNTLGILGAYTGIGYGYVQGDLLASEAGFWFGVVGLFGGLNCLFISWLSGYFRADKWGI
ncbi:MAG: helix-turn-helix domain-containing protein [Pseudohongiellaceae bacterium]